MDADQTRGILHEDVCQAIGRRSDFVESMRSRLAETFAMSLFETVGETRFLNGRPNFKTLMRYWM